MRTWHSFCAASRSSLLICSTGICFRITSFWSALRRHRCTMLRGQGRGLSAGRGGHNTGPGHYPGVTQIACNPRAPGCHTPRAVSPRGVTHPAPCPPGCHTPADPRMATSPSLPKGRGLKASRSVKGLETSPPPIPGAPSPEGPSPHHPDPLVFFHPWARLLSSPWRHFRAATASAGGQTEPCV